MRRWQRTATVVSVVGLVWGLGCEFSGTITFSSGRAEEEFSVSTAFEDVGSVSIDWLAGDVLVRFDENASEITASGTITVRAGNDAEAESTLAEVSIEFTVAESFPLQVFLRLEEPSGLGVSVSADLEVVIPGGVSVSVSSENSAVTVRGNTGSTTVSVSNGNVELIAQTGDATVETINGRIDIDSLSGSVEAVSVNSTVDVTAEPGPEDSLTAETTNGWVRIRVPGDTAAELRLESFLGGLEFQLSDFTVEGLEVDFNRLTATLNGGGGQIVGATVNGSVSFGSL